jgi:hypothetical protein
MTAAASGLVSGSGATSASPFHFADWPTDWVALYAAREFLLIDPVPRWARISGSAIPGARCSRACRLETLAMP